MTLHEQFLNPPRLQLRMTRSEHNSNSNSNKNSNKNSKNNGNNNNLKRFKNASSCFYSLFVGPAILAAGLNIIYAFHQHEQQQPQQQALATARPHKTTTDKDHVSMDLKFSDDSWAAVGSSKSSLSSPPHHHHLPDPICLTPPGQGDPDNTSQAYAVLHRLGYYQSNPTTEEAEAAAAAKTHPKTVPKKSLILCVVPFFSPDLEQAALRTFVKVCDGALILRNNGPTNHNNHDDNHDAPFSKTSNGMKSSSSSNATIPIQFLHLDLQNDYRWREDVMAYLSSPNAWNQTAGNNDDNVGNYWIYWASPDRYPIIGFIRRAVRALQATNNSSNKNNNADETSGFLLESWLIRKFQDYEKPRGFLADTSDCSVARIWNQPMTHRILGHCRHRSQTNPVFECPLDKNKNGIDCAEIKIGTEGLPWIQFLKYTEILVPGGPLQIYRIHSIISGLCDPFWDRELGALDEKGNPGYIHDPTHLHNHPRPLNLNHPSKSHFGVCDLPLGQGDEGPQGAKGLKKIQVDIPAFDMPRKKLLCLVYTHEARHNQLAAVAETWGPKCDGFLAASTKTDPSLGAVHLLHEGPEIYENMWMKTAAMFKYVHKHYINDFDLFHVSGDDTYLIVENLHHMILTGTWKGNWSNDRPLYFGGPLLLRSNSLFCGGGAGYTMNAAALRLLVQDLLKTPGCKPHWQGPQEDMIVGSCFHNFGINCIDTNDMKGEGRYHALSVQSHASWKKTMPMLGWQALRSHGIKFKEKLGQISSRSISFHLKNEKKIYRDFGMRRYHAILYHLCPSNTTLYQSRHPLPAKSD